MTGLVVTININMDRKCSVCRKKGALDSGLCLKCAADRAFGPAPKKRRKGAGMRSPKHRPVHIPAIDRLEPGDKVRWVNDRSREQEGTFVKRSAVNPAEAIIRPADGGQWLSVQVGRLERVR